MWSLQKSLLWVHGEPFMLSGNWLSAVDHCSVCPFLVLVGKSWSLFHSPTHGLTLTVSVTDEEEMIISAMIIIIVVPSSLVTRNAMLHSPVRALHTLQSRCEWRRRSQLDTFSNWDHRVNLDGWTFGPGLFNAFSTAKIESYHFSRPRSACAQDGTVLSLKVDDYNSRQENVCYDPSKNVEPETGAMWLFSPEYF